LDSSAQVRSTNININTLGQRHPLAASSPETVVSADQKLQASQEKAAAKLSQLLPRSFFALFLPLFHQQLGRAATGRQLAETVPSRQDSAKSPRQWQVAKGAPMAGGRVRRPFEWRSNELAGRRGHL